MAGQTKQWLVNVTAYTLAGSLSSALVGTILASAGELLFPTQSGVVGVSVAIAIGLVTMSREFGWVSFKLPQLGRQTKDFWSKTFPGPVAAALWGFDLGLIFTTWLTFSGVWLLVAVAVVARDWAFGAALFVSYWLGRALSVWIATRVMRDANATPQFLSGIHGQYRWFQRVHGLALAGSLIVLTAWLII